MKKKQYKLKKEAKVLLIIIVILIIGAFIARAIYKDYVYKNSYEYKLEMHGYSEEEVKILIKNLDDKYLDKLLKSTKDTTIISFLKEKYYISKNLDRYLAYYDKHKKEDISDIVTLININGDYEYYEHDIESDVSKNELLLCNKYYKLSSEYVPEDLVTINNKYYYGEAQQVREEVYNAFIDMWNAANNEGIYLIINSSYRSYQDQEAVYNEYKDLYGESGADSIAARPGYSEHQTGLSVDIFSKDNTSTKTFKDSNAYKWLLENSYKYGFILRYPEGKENLTGYNFEAWHYRYIGKKVAKEVHDKNLTYDEYYAYFIENTKK